jgi:hypothetical protein
MIVLYMRRITPKLINESHDSNSRLKRKRLDMKKRILTTIATITLLISLQSIGYSANDLEVSMGRKMSGKIIAPIGDTIEVWFQPMPFYVVLKNTSKSTVEAPVDNVFSFEVIEEDGKKFTIQKKEKYKSKRSSVYMHMSAGDTRTIKVVMDPAEWENVKARKPGERKVFRARVVYALNTKKIYSKYYKIIHTP